MCDLSDKLIAWLDHELPPREAAALRQHVETCEECRRCVAAYKEVGEAINEYCDASVESPVRRALPRWMPVLTAAAVVALLLLLPRTSIEERPPQIQMAANAPAVVEASATVAPAPIRKSAHRRRVAASAQIQNVSWIPAEPAVQIAFPADAMFAPGAVPQGVSFSADLTIAADGSAQRLRLRP